MTIAINGQTCIMVSMMNDMSNSMKTLFDLKKYATDKTPKPGPYGRDVVEASLYKGIPIEFFDVVSKMLNKAKHAMGSKEVIRYRYRGPRAHRKGAPYFNSYYKKMMVPSNSNNTQSMCHKRDAVTFAVYCYEQ